MKKVLILGAQGFLGSNLHSKISEEHYWHIRRPLVSQAQDGNLIIADLQSESSIERMLKEVRADIIINCLALTDLEYCEQNEDEAYWVNSDIPKYLAKYSAKNEVDLYHFSTDAVYKDSRNESEENENLSPKSIYGLSKALGESNIVDLLASARILRTNFVGINSKGVGLLNFYMSSLLTGKQVLGFKDVYFNTVEVNALSTEFLRVYRNLPPGIYNFTGAEKMTKFDFGLLVAQTLGCDQTLVVPSYISSTKWARTRNSNQVMCTRKISNFGVRFPSLQSQLQEILVATIDN